MKVLSILELFILSCINRGLTTPYLMQREGGLSLGATSPTLPKMVKLGLVHRFTDETPTNRPRHEYSLTREGKQQVKLGWKTHLEAPTPPSDLDALLRLVEMAKYNGAVAVPLAELVKRAAKSRANMAERCSLEAASLDAAPVSYRAAKANLDSLRYHAEADGLMALASEIGKQGSSRKSKPHK
jgi:DNA-binding PadR family transcriptional regulator